MRKTLTPSRLNGYNNHGRESKKHKRGFIENYGNNDKTGSTPDKEAGWFDKDTADLDKIDIKFDKMGIEFDKVAFALDKTGAQIDKAGDRSGQTWSVTVTNVASLL